MVMSPHPRLLARKIYFWLENINITARWAAEGGARLQPVETQDVGGDFSPETEICSHGWTGLRFNKPDWDRNYSWLPEPKRLINGIFMKGTTKMNI